MNPDIFLIVKEHIDRLDRMGFLDMGAPTDEYDIESRKISEVIQKGMNAEEIARVIADTFSKYFSQKECPETFAAAAKAIYKDLNP